MYEILIMGQHTWFVTDKDLYNESVSLYKEIDDSNEGITYLDEYEIRIREERIDEIEKSIHCDFHDCFRTHKRNEDKTYIDDVITSRKNCIKWLEDNSEFVTNMDKDYLMAFWDKYPNGAIYFG